MEIRDAHPQNPTSLNAIIPVTDSPKGVELSAKLSGHGGIGNLKARATLSARFSGTGRTVAADEIYGQIDSWWRMPEPSCSELFQHVRDALRECPAVSLDKIAGFRGRHLPGCTPLREDFGPPPRSIAPANRYNQLGSPALYLCTVREAVGRELSASTDVWVQRFQIPLAGLRIVDLRSPEARSDQLLASLMWFAELAGTEGYPCQEFSRLVASMVAELFDGMLVFGVRGDHGLLYSNLVMFEPGETWRTWLTLDLPCRL